MDVIRATRKLGLQYLWIDSLCIIQKSDEDWRREASKMAEAYQRATFNILVEAAGNCQEG